MLAPQVNTLDTRIAKPPDKVADKFYSSPEWRELLNAIIKVRGWICQDPRCTRPNGPWRRIYGDHIIELRDGGARLDPDNVLLRCASCHTRKTVEARAARQAAAPAGPARTA
jgi:5-methylcytosine-specific restriction protein A